MLLISIICAAFFAWGVVYKGLDNKAFLDKAVKARNLSTEQTVAMLNNNSFGFKTALTLATLVFFGSAWIFYTFPLTLILAAIIIYALMV